MVYKTEEYNRLKERFETLNMALEESSNRYHEICERYELKLNEKDQDISRLVKDVDNHKTIVKELKEKIVSIERK
jgi:predicted RNase H-like nuclease (RuvC/YqgF family)